MEVLNFEEPKKFSVLDTYGENLKTKFYLTDPAIGRDKEIKETLLILLTPEKSAMLVGKPGIGKTAIVEGIGYRMQKGEVPDALKNYDLIKINISSLLGNVSSDGVNENKLQILVDELKERAITNYTEKHSESETLESELKQVKKIADNIEATEVRRLITDEKVRPDGRGMTEIRELSTRKDLLPRTHGSALFTRGQTQALAITTLGALGEHQILDGIMPEDEKRFMFHYNFPAFSVGETGRYGAPGRREIGHGALAERALLQVMPDEAEFPYTVRVVSEVLESNGSSSQATICAGCLSLMAAGVPIKAPVAGIAMGLISNGKKYTILTDIQGLEDHMGDMDFKVAGTKEGITALQMDIKIKGVTKAILKEALEEAKKARMKILDVMATAIESPRKELSKYAPKVESFMINPDKIKDVIGKGGEMITKIILESSNVKSVNDKDAVKVDIDDDGKVIIYHMDKEVIEKTKKMIEDITKEVETGKIYNAKVVKVEDFGAFVELWPGCEGLVHVSQLDTKRVEKPSDVVSVGDEIIVKSLGYDNKGRLNLSRKEALPKSESTSEEKPKKEPKKGLFGKSKK